MEYAQIVSPYSMYLIISIIIVVTINFCQFFLK